MPRRSKLAIIAKVLSIVVSEPVNPTRLATMANMPYDRLKRLLRELEEKGLIVVVEGERGKLVEATPKGVKLFHELERLRRVLEDFGLEIG